MPAAPQPEGPFPNTRWSRVVRLRETDAAARRAALEELCQTYLRPVTLYLAALGGGQDAEDIAQDFFATFLRQAGFERADPNIGRLRAYLKTAARHHFLHWKRDHATLRAGGGVAHTSLDELATELPGDDAPSAASYDLDWALAVLGQALAALRAGYAERGRTELFEALKPALLGAAEALPARLAEQLGLSPNALAVEQHRARRRLAELLRAAVADTVADPREVEPELRHLLAVLAQRGEREGARTPPSAAAASNA